MIRLTKLNGEEIFLNYFQVLYIRQIPETKIIFILSETVLNQS